jgi:hypothetical protein
MRRSGCRRAEENRLPRNRIRDSRRDADRAANRLPCGDADAQDGTVTS